jgi:murein L,D-transpeptidase YafK
MRKINVLLRYCLLASALLPWNATAIDKSDLGKFAAYGKFGANYTEGLLVKSLLAVTQGQVQEALDTIDQLLQTTPNFKLAHLVRGDLLMARAQELQGFGNTATSPEAINDLREEARKRIERYLSERVASSIPEPLWQMDSSQKHALVVDAAKSRMYVYRNDNGQPRYVADYYVTVGKNGSEKQIEGDKRTPVGVYVAGSKLTRKLPDFYGTAAYPLDYPNEWDRKQGKKGHGIWLHGTPSDTYSRPPRASDGCVVIANPDLKSLASILQNGNTPVIITNDVQWLDAKDASADKLKLSNALESWRKDWETQDTDQYLAHYSTQFFNRSTDLSGWAKEKRRIQATKMDVEIKLSNVSMFRYPANGSAMAMVTFDQDYKSNHLDSRMRKRQYWIQEDNRWKILYEGAV